MSKRSKRTTERLAEAKRSSVGHLLLRTARLFNERAVTRVQRGGAPAFRLSHTILFPHIDMDGTRLVDLAERVGITKQSVGELVSDLERSGVVRRVPDPDDGRAKRVYFTERGQRALLHGVETLVELERELAAQIGSSSMRALQRGLDRLLGALEASAGTD